jgi:hypothetical protein
VRSAPRDCFNVSGILLSGDIRMQAVLNISKVIQSQSRRHALVCVVGVLRGLCGCSWAAGRAVILDREGIQPQVA